jgi:hypothetical protein
MKGLTLDSLGQWTWRTEIVILAALGLTVLLPAGVVWSAGAGATLIGSAVVAAVLVRPRAIPSLAAAIATAGRPGPSRRPTARVNGGE